MKKLLSLLLIAALTLAMPLSTALSSAVPCDVQAAVTNNQNHWEYWGWQNWSQPVRSYLYDNGDGSVTRVEYTGSAVTVEVFDSSRNIVSANTVQMELPLFGGFYAGSEYNFLVFGQENTGESNDVEVIRTVKYSKNWTRLGSASLFGENTYIPFEAGSLRMTEYAGFLFVRTCHKMYANNGVNHQANLTYIVNISTLQVRECWSRVANITWGGYCSHSFNQFIAIDGNKLVALDHGDAHPRSAVLVRYTSSAAGSSTLTGGNEYVETVVYPGNTGNNYTYSCIGGLEVTSKGYMTVGNTNLSESSSVPRNVYITVTDRNDFTESGTTTVWLTNYTSTGVSVSNPQLIKINDDKLMVLWKEGSTVKYVFVDGSGNLITEITEAPGYKVSDCQPIVIGNKVEWYVTSNSAPVFYSIAIPGDGLLGDVDCNGVVDMSDISMLFSYLNGGSVTISAEGLQNADANGDGSVNVMDITAIFNIIANS